MKFDPYSHWLRVPTSRRPLTHYELLRLDNFEEDVEAVYNAVQYQTGELKQYKNGPHAELVARLQGEINQASICLTNAARKKAYDVELLKIPLYASLRNQRHAPARPQLDAATSDDPEAARLERLASLLQEAVKSPSSMTGFTTTNPLRAPLAPTPIASNTDKLLKAAIIVGGLCSVVLAVSAVMLLARWNQNEPKAVATSITEQQVAVEKQTAAVPAESAASAAPGAKSDDPAKPQAQAEAQPPALPVPADVFDALPDAWIAPPLTDISKRDLPVTLGIVNLPVGRLKELTLELRDAENDKEPHSALAVRTRPAQLLWQFVTAVAGQAADRGVPLGDFTMRGQSLCFYWGGRAPFELPPESRRWSLRIAAGEREKIISMALPGFAAPVAVNAPRPAPLAPPNLPVVPSAAKVPTGPLGLAIRIDLPDQRDEEHRAEEIALGKLPVAADELLTLALLEPPVPRKAAGKLRLQVQAGAELPAWQVFYDKLTADKPATVKGAEKPEAAEPAAPPGTVAESAEVARLWCRPNAEVAFCWLPAAYALAEADRLRNCALAWQRGDLQQHVCLRTPAGGSAYMLDLQEEHIHLPIAGAGLPDSDLMQVEVLSHSGFPAAAKLLPAGSKKKSDPVKIVVRAEEPTIELHFREFDNSKGHALRISPLLCDGDSDETLPFTAERMGNLQTGIAREINKTAALLRSEYAEKAALGQQLASAQFIGEEGKRKSAITALTIALRTNNSAIQRLSRRAVVLDAQSKAVPSIVAAGQQIHQRASLKLRVFFLAGNCQVDVLRLE